MQARTFRHWYRVTYAQCTLVTLGLALLTLGLGVADGRAQRRELAPSIGAQAPLYEYRGDHSPDGIGKFYLGREIAQVAGGHGTAVWLERLERDDEEKTELLIECLNLALGQVVADIGAGTGYFSRRMARKIGPRGKVYAVDIQPEMLALLTNKMAETGVTNVVPVLGKVTEPGLASDSVDLVLLVDVYHELSHPHEMMQAICRALRPEGRVVFVEFRGEDPAVPIKPLHKMTEAQVRKEASVHALEWVETLRPLPRQHIIIFKKSKAWPRGPKTEPAP